MELELGMKKYCHLVDIFYNYNFHRCLLASPIHKVQGAVNDSCCQKRPYGRYCRHKFQTQLTFKKPIVTGKFSSHPLKKKKEKTPNGHGTRYSTSLFITGGIPIKMTSSQIPFERMVNQLYANCKWGRELRDDGLPLLAAWEWILATGSRKDSLHRQQWKISRELSLGS